VLKSFLLQYEAIYVVLTQSLKWRVKDLLVAKITDKMDCNIINLIIIMWKILRKVTNMHLNA
jgi:hypothetical protein